jgi:hypothetical protein
MTTVAMTRPRFDKMTLALWAAQVLLACFTVLWA